VTHAQPERTPIVAEIWLRMGGSSLQLGSVELDGRETASHDLAELLRRIAKVADSDAERFTS
jgi:hypothetical protein